MTTASAEYFRAWRAAHPDYRRREVARTARRRADGREDRTAEYRNASRKRTQARAEVQPLEEIPPLHVGHPIFEAARELVGPTRSGLTVYLDPMHEDLLSEAVVALLAGEDPVAAVRRFRSGEHAWRRVTAPITFEVAAA